MNKLPAIFMVLIFTLTACSGGVATPAAASAASAPVAKTQTSNTSTVEATATDAAPAGDNLAENAATHDDAADYVWDNAAVISIVLSENSITVDGEGVTVEGSQATITSAGTYSLSGSLADGQICVDTKDEGAVRLVLNGVDIHSSTRAPIYILNAEKTVLLLADNTENFVADGATYVFEDSAADEPHAAIFSKSDLTIAGSGALTVTGTFSDGISSKDGLIITSGTLTVNAVDDGIRGKDYLVVKAGTLTVTAQGDGLKSDNEEDATQGYVSIAGGVFQITSGGDAIYAQTDVMIAAGTFRLISGGGSCAQIDANTSAKGIKGVAKVTIDGGTFTINSADDALHSNGSLVIASGAFSLASGDDGVHADATLTLNGGDMDITESYEGLESAVIIIHAGNIHIIASDDGVNVAAGNDGSGTAQGEGQGGLPGGGPRQDNFVYSGDYYLHINGGYLAVEANGDGIDVNGAIEMTGGIVLVNGPTENMNGPVDYDATFKLTGGFFVATGSAGMALAPSVTSTQYSVLLNLTSTQAAGTLIHLQNSAGEEILTFSPAKPYQSLAFSSSQLVNGLAYTVYTGGSSTGTVTDSLYEGGTYTPGIPYHSFTISSMVTTIGAAIGTARSRP